MATYGEDSLRENRAPRGRVSIKFQEGLMEERAPRSSGNKQREVARISWVRDKMRQRRREGCWENTTEGKWVERQEKWGGLPTMAPSRPWAGGDRLGTSELCQCQAQ